MWTPLGNSRKTTTNLFSWIFLFKRKKKVYFRDVISSSDRRGGRVWLGSPRDSVSGNYPAAEAI